MSFMPRPKPREALDLDAIRLNHPLAEVAGAVVKLNHGGKEWTACCPFHPDKSPSFTIFSDGRRFHCFGCGAGGDVLDFVQRLHGVGLREAAEMLTGGDLPTIHVAFPPQGSDDSDRREEAREVWIASDPIVGTLAENYLRTRGLILTLPDTLRFSRLRYGKSGELHPALVALVVDVGGQPTGIQRTYLNASGTGKAAVPKAKLSLGRVSGGAIRLAPSSAALVVCEGLEDGLTLQQELGRSVWVAAGASMLPNMAFPAEVRTVAIGGDNDLAGRIAANKAAESFALRGLTTRVFFPVTAKDFNAELTERSPAQ